MSDGYSSDTIAPTETAEEAQADRYTSPGARLLRQYTEARPELTVWSPERGWHHR